MEPRQQIIEAAKIWREKTGKSLCTLSHKIAKNGNWLSNLISGADLTGKTYQRAKSIIESDGVDFSNLPNGKK